MRRIVWSALVLIALSELGWGGVALRLHGHRVRWPEPRIRLQISRVVHLSGSDLGVDKRDSAAGVHSAVVDAVQQWASASDGSVSIDVELTDEQLVSPQRNLVTFTDPAPFDDGTCNKEAMVACAVLNFNPGTGEMLAASIAFNPYKRHSALGVRGANDIGLVALHEVGHLLGLDHTPLTDSAMSATAEMEAPGGTGGHYARRQLAQDDTVTLRSVYGNSDPFSRVRGTVLQHGQVVPNAHVVALSTARLPVFSTQTNDAGQYEVLAPPGEYSLVAELPDGPTVFWTEAGGKASESEAITLAEGETRENVDFRLGDGPVLKLTHVGLRVNGRYLGYPRTVVARGRSYDLGMGRTPAGTPGRVRILGETIRAEGEPVMPASGPGFLFQRIQIPPDAPLGAYTPQFHTDDAMALIAGGLRVAPNPQIDGVTPVDGEPGEPYLPGQQIVLTGRDLADSEAQGERWTQDAPLPTQLRGTSVVVGDVYAQLVSVHPERIVLVVPAAISESSTPVRVVTGIGVESNVLDVNLTVQ